MVFEGGGTSGTFPIPICIDTNQFCNEDLLMFIECSDYIEQVRRRKGNKQRWSLSPRKTREESFEIGGNSDAEILLDPQRFNVNNLSLSMKNLFQYFSEDVAIKLDVDSRSNGGSERDLHRPVIVDVSPKVSPTVRYKSRLGRKPTTLDELDSRLRHPLEVSLSPAMPTKLKQFFAESNSDEIEKANTSVQERITYFNSLAREGSASKSARKKIDVHLEYPVEAIKVKLFESFAESSSTRQSETPVLPAESVRSQIEKFEKGLIPSPYSILTYASAEELSSPTLVKNLQNFFKEQELAENAKKLDDSRSSSSLESSVNSAESTSSPPSGYGSLLCVNTDYVSPDENIPPPYTLTPDSQNSDMAHPFLESGLNLQKLQGIVQMIKNIRSQGFIDISQDLFEQFLQMLCVCADICLLEGVEACDGDLDDIHDLLQPPENELQKTHDGTVALSEHQLRVQASLQRLNIPDWFRQYNTTPKTDPTGYRLSNFNRKRASESGRWAGLNSKTTSLSSLGSQRSDRSPLLLSPSAHSHGGQTGFSRWSTSHLNSTQTSPSVSTRGSFCRGGVANSSVISGQSACGVTMRNSYRQPYLGWRSQEKLAQPRTPHERLASSVLAQHHQHHHHHQHQKRQQQDEEQQQKQEPPVTPEIQSSIKEVTSAIVHYVNDQTNRTVSRSRSTSPNSRKCWVESSFVGVRPVESPQTPVIDNSFSATTQSGGPGATSSTHSGATDILHMNGVGDTVNEPGRFVSNSPNSLQVDQQSRFRRRSEGDAQRQAQQKLKLENAQQQNILISTTNPSSDVPLQSPRRVSLDSSESKTASELLVRCRNTKCEQFASAGDAKKQYKSCHNCTHQYCSRECRRAHWEKHRKACLHSRVSNLCRQVLSSCKDDMDTLRHLSLLARKGYYSQGRGVVRILFRSPEGAEAFIKNGFQCVGEASYVRWPDLMPSEMGLELYSELLRLSTEYKPDSKMLIYVAICVVSEAPASSGTASVKWERQLVSRCAKLKLSKSVLNEIDYQVQPTVAAQDSFTEILILTFNPLKKVCPKDREIVLANIQTLLCRRGVFLRKHYPEIFQRLQNYVEGVTDKIAPVTIHPRDSQTGQGFVCIIMPNSGEMDLSRLPKSDTGNRISTFDVGEDLFES